MIEGNFIVIEGIDGAGTSTQTQLLSERFLARGLPVLTTREPTTGPVGALIRQALTHRFVVPGIRGGVHPPSWKTMALLFAADRLDHLEAEILPNLQDGVTVISDRYDLSSLAYQSATAPEGTATTVVEWLRSINHHARRPDLTIVLDVPAEVAAQRRRGRAQATELYEIDELQQRLANLYRDAESLVPGDLIHHLSGARDIALVAEEIATVLWKFRGERR